MARPSYTDQQRSEALALYVEHGPSEAARRTGIPKGTITKWAKAQGLETVSRANNEAAVEAVTVQHRVR